ncbi:hypothetical protein HGB13_00275 [bacterium]|nr:hypothetical protein [bacterium]
MAYTAQKLIQNAYYLSGVVSKGLQYLTTAQDADGLDLLNSILDIKGADYRLIPYFSSKDITAVPGQEKYFIEKLVEAENFVFYINSVRYAMKYTPRNQYFATPRAENIKSLPYSWHLERTKGGSNLYIYFLPSSDYPMTIWGKFGFSEVALTTDLSTTYDLFYIEYLKYSLASCICSEYSVEFQPQPAQRLKVFEQQLTDISPTDFTMNKISSFTKGVDFNYGIANLGTGWWP